MTPRPCTHEAEISAQLDQLGARVDHVVNHEGGSGSPDEDEEWAWIQHQLPGRIATLQAHVQVFEVLSQQIGLPGDQQHPEARVYLERARENVVLLGEADREQRKIETGTYGKEDRAKRIQELNELRKSLILETPCRSGRQFTSRKGLGAGDSRDGQLVLPAACRQDDPHGASSRWSCADFIWRRERRPGEVEHFGLTFLITCPSLARGWSGYRLSSRGG